MDLDPSSVLAAFDANAIDVNELVHRLDDLSRNAEKWTKDGVVSDDATRLAATKELLDLLQIKAGMKSAGKKAAPPQTPGLVGALQRVIEAEVVPKPPLPS